MNRLVAALLALAAPASAFVPSAATAPAKTTALSNNLRDMAAYPDQERQMGDFAAFDRNGAFSRSPRGDMGGDRMYTQDGFDPYSAYGGNFGGSPSEQRRMGGMQGGMGMGPMMGGGYGEPMMGGMNGARADNTMGGFNYSSRVRGYGAGRPFEMDFEMGPEGMGPMGPGGMMDYDEGYGPQGGYGGFEGGDQMSRMGP